MSRYAISNTSDYKRAYMRLVGAKIPAAPKKPRRAKGTPPPMSGQAARPRAATPLSRRPFAFGTRVTIVLLTCGLSNTRPKSRARRVYSRSWRPRAKFLVAKGESHDALGWRHGVGLLEKYSRPPASLFFGADIGGGVPFARRNARPKSDGEAERSVWTSPHKS